MSNQLYRKLEEGEIIKDGDIEGGYGRQVVSSCVGGPFSIETFLQFFRPVESDSMTKRERFAMAAMQAAISTEFHENKYHQKEFIFLDSDSQMVAIADFSAKMADALIAALNAKEDAV